MNERPNLDKQLNEKTFRSFYYLKEELVDFCRENKLPTSGGKIEITERIGKGFSFNVVFQKWLKENTGKTYSEAIAAYYDILEKKKKGKTTIDKQFEYNTYIRDFFANNTGKSLEEAIQCWKYKKSLQGHNRYENSDLTVLS